MNIKIFYINFLVIMTFITNISSATFENILEASEFKKNLSYYIDLNSMLNLRLTSKGIKQLSTPIIRNLLEPLVDHNRSEFLSYNEVDGQAFIIRPHSSLISCRNVRDTFLNYIYKANHKIVLVSDQITDLQFIDHIIRLKIGNPHLSISVMCGENPYVTIDLKKIFNEHHISYHSHPPSKTHGRMHNKFILIDDYGTILGSPNITTSAFEKNIESFVAIYNKEINSLYCRYYDYLNIPSDKGMLYLQQTISLTRTVDTLNHREEFPVKVCFAKIKNMRDFLKDCVNNSYYINISMFLIGRSDRDPKNDVVSKLISLKNDGILYRGKLLKTAIEIQIDANQFESMPYVSQTLRALKSTEIKVSTVKPKNGGVLHDKLFVVRKDSGFYTVIGSAGLTKAVEDNSNAENMILIKDRNINLFFGKHIMAIRHKKESIIYNLNIN